MKMTNCSRLVLLRLGLLLLAPTAFAAGLPRIDSVDSPMEEPNHQGRTVFMEGRTVLLRITGEHLTADLTPLFDYQGIEVGAFSQWTANGATAGVRFQIPVLPLLAAETALEGELVLVAPNGSRASWPITIAGLDEFHLTANESLIVTNRSQRVFSEINVDAGAMIRVEAEGAIDWQSTGPVSIAGEIDARGRDGTSAVGGLGGSVFGRKGGRGGDGGLLSGNVPPQAGGDGDHPLPARRIAVPGGFGYIEPASAGGLAGNNDGAASREGCTVFDQAPCVSAISALFDTHLLPDDHDFTKPLLAGAQGWSGVGVDENHPRPRPGYAGGGGGGGGAGPAGPGYIEFDGGGGGQGGEGGRGVRIVGGSTMTLNDLVTTDGGRGGDGWNGGDTEPMPGTPTLFDLTYSGGGGGGGAAGELILASRGEFQRLAGVTTTSTGGGEAGQGGVLLYDGSVIHEEPWVERGIDRVTRGRQSLNSAIGFQSGPVFAPGVWEDLVTASTIVELLDTATAFRPLAPRSFEIRGELPGQVRVVEVAGVTNSLGSVEAPYRAMLVLFPGFNTILARPTDGEEPIDDADYSLIFRRIFTLGGVDACDAACQALLANPFLEDGIVRYIAGDGIGSHSIHLVDNVPALETGLNSPQIRLSYGPDGSLYFTERSTNTTPSPNGPYNPGHVIRRINPAGNVSTITGGGINTADHILASEASLNQRIEAMAIGSDGSIYLLEAYSSPVFPQRIRKIGPDGFIHTVVGGGTDKFFSATPVPATSIDLDAQTDYDMALDAAGNIYLSRRLSKVTPINFPPFAQTNLVGAISRVTPDGMLQNIVGGHFLSGPGQGGGLDDEEWEGRPALAAGAFPKTLAVSPDGQRLYFHTSTANFSRLVRADLDPFTSTPAEPRYVLHNVTTNASGSSVINDNVLAQVSAFASVYDLSLAPDSSLFIGGISFVSGVGSRGTIHKITPGGVSHLVYGGVGDNLIPTNGQPARFHGYYRPNYTDTLVGPDNRLVFSPKVGAGDTRIAKIVQPWDAPLPFAPPPSVSFGTATMVVWETHGSLWLPIRREGYAGTVNVLVNKPVGPDISGAAAPKVVLNVEETDKTVQLFNVSNNFIVDGTRTVEFTLQYPPGGGWTPPLTDPAMQELIGLPDRLTLVILDDDSPLPQPVLNGPLLLENGLVRLESLGAPNRDYILQASFNLFDWADTQTNQSPIGLLQFQVDHTIQQRFFRLRH